MAITDLLATQVINRVVEDLVDVTTLPQELKFLNRIPIVSAIDSEIIARRTARVTVADFVLNDHKAVIRATRPVRTQTVDIPKYKHGSMISEGMQELLDRINAQQATRRQISLAEEYVANSISELRDGVYARMETMCVAMAIDAFSYSKMGIQIENATWGMPSDLKITPLHLWTDPTNATPIDDILTLRNLMLYKYGVVVDRITLSTPTLQLIYKTDEFLAKSALYRQIVGFTVANFPTADLGLMKILFTRMLEGMEVETYDAQVWAESMNGAETSSRYFPVNKVLISTSQADGNASLWDFGNGEVQETRPGAVPLIIGGDFGAVQEGPVAYATAADPHGNPPGQILWAVGRGFPRKYKESITGVITAY